MIIGVSGPYAAGKGEVVRFLVERSFYALSLSDLLREELTARGLTESRELMIETGNELRRTSGPGVLAERAVVRLEPDRNYVIDSIRHPAEVEALRAAGRRFILIWVDAAPATRLERMRMRQRPGDPASQAEMTSLEGRELEGEATYSQQLLAVRNLADETVTNDSTLHDLHGSVQRILQKGLYFERPPWDDYFMSIARVVASRSNCVKRKVAAVITLDKRIISTGYNGTPRGVRNCNEGGCPRCGEFGPGGADLGECLCSHGEENAITQAAYHGVAVRGATIYSTFCPCLLCTKMIINAGIAEVVFNADYPLGDLSLALLREADVAVRQVGQGT